MRYVAATMAAAMALSGCATTGKFVTKMDNFVGQNEVVLIANYGVPQGVYAMADGTKVVQYSRGGTVDLPGPVTTTPVVTSTSGNVAVNRGLTPVATGTYSGQSTTYMKQQGPAIQLTAWCTVRFTINASGTILAWKAEGNHCVSDG